MSVAAAAALETTSQDDDDDTSSPEYLELTTQRYEKEEEEVQDNTPHHLPATNRRNIGVFLRCHGDEEDSEIRRIDIKEDNNNNNKEEIEDDDDDISNKSSVFSLESFYRINVQCKTTTTKNSSSIHHHHHHRAGVLLTHDAPFASVVVKEGGGIQNFNDDITTNSVCQCQCIYFTMRETICLIISAMGCGVFLAGIISLCFYLSGWWNDF